jgi:hypothetical protein
MNGLFRCLPLLALVAVPIPVRAADSPGTVEFNRDVRPILSDICYACHGPDKGKRKADLRLDTEQGIRSVVVPGKPLESELLKRLTEADPKQHMPPSSVKKDLSPDQVALLRRWIEQGAPYQPHWAFIPPKRPALPLVRNASRVNNGLDAFVFARLEKAGLEPSLEADRATLLRRVTLDLTGLPPSIEELNAFLKDDSPDAYRKAVDRLLGSPRYGERMAVRWLDAARYADTNGYQNDGERIMWRWRDWVIDAFNANMPFDQFTIEQLAGDLLPGAGLEQKIATGFNRNHRGNSEGGIIPEEYAAEYVADRVETTATVWLGLTLTCARCHDHKYDPVSQKEFYRLFAFFNNVPEFGRAVKFGNSPPMLRTPTRRQQEVLERLRQEEDRAQVRIREQDPALRKQLAGWLRAGGVGKEKAETDWAPTEGLVAHFPLDGPDAGLVFREGPPSFAAGRKGQAAELDGKRFLDAGNVGAFGFDDRFTLSAWIRPQRERAGMAIVSRMRDEARQAGYGVFLSDGCVEVDLVVRWLDDALRVRTEERLEAGRWHHVAVSYDGSRLSSGVRVYIDGRLQKLRVDLDLLNQSFATSEPFRIGAGGGPERRFHGLLDDVRVYRRVLSAEEVLIAATAEAIEEVARLPEASRTAGQQAKLLAYFVDRRAGAEVRAAHQALREAQARRQAAEESVPTTMVMEEMPRPRNTHILIRGQYDRPGERVGPGVPAVLPPMPAGVPENRLGLARWLTNPKNPLTARVTVNRVWQMYFGAGLVRTPEDFGAQGEPPTHPELLDWLAVEFQESGWDLKHLHRLIVNSSTYRQSSRLRPELRGKDPENRLLARMPRLRLSAEMVRDNALAASGLLVERLGGPSVKPYQPDGLWKELGDVDYLRDRGDNLYRRGLYTLWKRTVAPPALVTFDAAGREVCNVRESRTNTPLQALTLLNDVTFVEAARNLAQKAVRDTDLTPAERVTILFRRVLARRPGDTELRILLAGLERHREHYRSHREEARALLGIGDSRWDERLDPADLAAYTAVASTVLNLDEAITRE